MTRLHARADAHADRRLGDPSRTRHGTFAVRRPAAMRAHRRQDPDLLAPRLQELDGRADDGLDVADAAAGHREPDDLVEPGALSGKILCISRDTAARTSASRGLGEHLLNHGDGRQVRDARAQIGLHRSRSLYRQAGSGSRFRRGGSGSSHSSLGSSSSSPNAAAARADVPSFREYRVSPDGGAISGSDLCRRLPTSSWRSPTRAGRTSSRRIGVQPGMTQGFHVVTFGV